jgi:hypothetical protein
MTPPIVGLDFDNTIVSYDAVFIQVARERGLPLDTATSKNDVRDHLRAIGREDDWTEMQGYVYGARMSDAAPFPGALDCIAGLVSQGVTVHIVSHRTAHPYRGPKHDLHRSARQWLEEHRFFDPQGVGLRRDAVFFELSKLDKIARIKSLGCGHFVDDLPEILALLDDHKSVKRVLFDPQRQHDADPGTSRVASWHEIPSALQLDIPNMECANDRH